MNNNISNSIAKYGSGFVDVISHSVKTGDAVGGQVEAFTGEGTASILTKVGVATGLFIIFGAIYNAEYIGNGAKYAFNQTDKFINKTFYGEASAKSTEPSLFKSFCSYTASVLTDSIYKQTIKPIFNEAWKLLLVDAIIEDVKSTASNTKDAFVYLYKDVFNKLNYTQKFAMVGFTGGAAVGGLSMVVAGCFNPALFASIPLATVIGGIGGCVVGVTLGLALDLLSNIPQVRDFIDYLSSFLPNDLKNTQKSLQDYATLGSVILAVVGTIVAPGAGTIVGSALGYALGAAFGVFIGFLEDLMKQSDINKMTESDKLALLSEDDQLLYKTGNLSDKEKQALLNKFKDNIKAKDVFGFESNLGLVGIKSGGAITSILTLILTTAVINPAVVAIVKGICLGIGLSLQIAFMIAAELAASYYKENNKVSNTDVINEKSKKISLEIEETKDTVIEINVEEEHVDPTVGLQKIEFDKKLKAKIFFQI